LRQWNQILKKGGSWIKVDFFFTQKNCSLWTSKDSKNCFILNHDPPTIKNLHYNTSDHLLNFLENSKNLNSIFIALCFKIEYNFICDEEDETFITWRSLVDEFFEKANKVISKVPYRLEFILDGEAKPQHCLINKWKPWKSGKLHLLTKFSLDKFSNDGFVFK
jgi:hypothetical protein